MESLYPEGEAFCGGAFGEGLVSSVLMRRDFSPDDAALARFLDHRPADPRTAELWHAAIRRPCGEALVGALSGSSGSGGDVYRALERGGRR